MNRSSGPSVTSARSSCQWVGPRSCPSSTRTWSSGRGPPVASSTSAAIAAASAKSMLPLIAGVQPVRLDHRHTAARPARSSGTPRPGRRTLAYSSKVVTRLGSTTVTYSAWKNAGLRSVGGKVGPVAGDGVAPRVAGGDASRSRSSGCPSTAVDRRRNRGRVGLEDGARGGVDPAHEDSRLPDATCRGQGRDRAP